MSEQDLLADCRKDTRMIDLQAIKERHPKEQVNALGSKDMQDIRDLLAEAERLTAALGLKDAEIERLHDLHLKRTKLTHKALLEVAELNERIESLDEIVEIAASALSELVCLKDLKDKYGKTEKYLERQPAAWAAARSALTQVDHGPCFPLKERIEQLEAALRKAVIMAKMSDGTWDEDTDGPELQAMESLIAGDTGLIPAATFHKDAHGGQCGDSECRYCSSEIGAAICGNEGVLRDGPMTCNRPPGHRGRHVACGAHHGIGSWPGTVEDT